MSHEDLDGAVALQRACFPAPFPENLLWNRSHLERHLAIFPAGQFVSIQEGQVIASASSTRISEVDWAAHTSWEETVGGPYLESFDPTGSTLYGLDISVHPEHRGQGLGRLLYQARFNLVASLGLTRYGTACRLPGFQVFSQSQTGATVEDYADHIVQGRLQDRTLTPLLRYELTFLGVIHDYMDDDESGNAAAQLEWKP
ncbi:MAG: GNAT family N-acetyltransferase [Chlorobia bacterium]|nr:GNAT family N-acetyltransferase [Fimbriimonadaceae bacterium]